MKIIFTGFVALLLTIGCVRRDASQEPGVVDPAPTTAPSPQDDPQGTTSQPVPQNPDGTTTPDQGTSTDPGATQEVPADNDL